MSKPEYQGPPEQHYNQQEARKYTTSSRIRKVQYELAQRAYELLELDENNGKQKDSNLVLLDIGCGSGLSGEILKENGHHWVGVDISRPMLDIARDEDECDSADLLQLDMGSGLPFRSGTFDGAISISAIQWLCHSNSKVEQPRRRLLRFFQSLFACLSRSARAVFQFYPNNQQQCELITQQALRAGFQGGLVVDRPDSPKQRKVFLVLSAGKEAAITHQPPLLARSKFNGEEGNEGRRKQHIQMTGRNRSGKDANLKKNDTTRNKTIDKKLKRLERRRRKGTTK